MCACQVNVRSALVTWNHSSVWSLHYRHTVLNYLRCLVSKVSKCEDLYTRTPYNRNCRGGAMLIFRTLYKIEKSWDESKTVSMTYEDSEQFVVVSSTALDLTRENFSDHIVSFCSDELPDRLVLKNVNDIVQLLLRLECTSWPGIGRCHSMQVLVDNHTHRVGLSSSLLHMSGSQCSWSRMSAVIRAQTLVYS